jgi:hypothetical protein
MRQLFVALTGILQRAQRRGVIGHNPMADAERLARPKPSGEFLLMPVQVEAVARAAAADWEPVLAGPGLSTRGLSDDAWTIWPMSALEDVAAIGRMAYQVSADPPRCLRRTRVGSSNQGTPVARRVRKATGLRRSQPGCRYPEAPGDQRIGPDQR